ncbi:MAG: hypothetical protein MSA13_05010 [Prevotella sp.]|nr:hypothetical protein [Prevotella sp.]
MCRKEGHGPRKRQEKEVAKQTGRALHSSADNYYHDKETPFCPAISPSLPHNRHLFALQSALFCLAISPFLPSNRHSFAERDTAAPSVTHHEQQSHCTAMPSSAVAGHTPLIPSSEAEETSVKESNNSYLMLNLF